MAFVGGDIVAALGAGIPQLVFQLDGTLDLADAATMYGVGAEMAEGGEPPAGPPTPRSDRRRRGNTLRTRGRKRT